MPRRRSPRELPLDQPVDEAILDAAAREGAGAAPAGRARRRGARRATSRRRRRPSRAPCVGCSRSATVRLQPVVTGQADASRKQRWIRPTAAAFEPATTRLGAKQAAAVSVLVGTPEGIDAGVLREQGIGSEVVRRLVALGLAAGRVARRGARSVRERIGRHVGCAGGAAVPADDRGAGRGARHARAADRPGVPAGAAAWRHRQRQDAGLPAAGARHAGGRTRRAAAGAGDRADVRRGLAVPPRLRRAPRDPAQRPVRRRALRPVAPHPARRGGHRHRHAVGGVRAVAAARAGDRRRGARHRVQAGGESALPRA